MENLIYQKMKEAKAKCQSELNEELKKIEGIGEILITINVSVYGVPDVMMPEKSEKQSHASDDNKLRMYLSYMPSFEHLCMMSKGKYIEIPEY